MTFAVSSNAKQLVDVYRRFGMRGSKSTPKQLELVGSFQPFAHLFQSPGVTYYTQQSSGSTTFQIPADHHTSSRRRLSFRIITSNYCTQCGSSFYNSVYKAIRFTAKILVVRFYNFTESCILPTNCVYVFSVDLRTNSDYFPIQH